VYPESSKFWRASDSFFQRVATSDQPYLRRKYREWVAISRAPERASKRYRFISGRLSRLPRSGKQAVQIRADPAFRENILAIGQTAAPIVTAELDRTLAAMAFNAWRNWPTKTGFSKALLSLEYTVASPNVLLVQLRSNAWYSFYIKSRQHGLGNKQPHRVLIFDPASGKLAKTATRVADQIDNFLNGKSA
jgi:hypothetical protein